MAKDYYKILGIAEDASVDEIKKAFRRQAVKHHPDQGGDEAKFKEINEAHEILSNPEKRQRYDQFGEAGLGGKSGFGGAGANANAGASFDFGGGLGDIFSSFFGGATHTGTQAPVSGRDVEVVLNLKFNEAIFGVEKTIKLSFNDLCPDCQGSRSQTGSKSVKCSACQGRGSQVRIFQTPLGNIQQQVSCRVCNGEGQKIDKPCSTCNGQGVTIQPKSIPLKIPAGIEDGMNIRFRDLGEKNYKGVAGDLYVIIQVAADKHFTREGDLILTTENISMTQAALGAKVKVKTLDGKITLKIPPGTQTGTDFKLTGRGVPHLNSSRRGDHIVSLHVEIPKRLNRRQKQILEQFQDIA